MSIKDFPFEIRDLEPKLTEELKEFFKGERTSYVLVGPKNYFFPSIYKELSSKLYNLEVKPTDIFVVSYARSGTTWTQELVWMIANDLDYVKSDALSLPKRYPFLENSILIHPQIYKELKELNKHSEENLKLLQEVTTSGVDLVTQMLSPRFIKTHLPMSLLPPNLVDIAKVVYVARDPRDVAVSFYHLQKDIKLHEYVGDFKRFWGYFTRGFCKTAGWRENFDEEMMQQAEQWVADNLRDTDLRFPE